MNKDAEIDWEQIGKSARKVFHDEIERRLEVQKAIIEWKISNLAGPNDQAAIAARASELAAADYAKWLEQRS